MSSSSRKITASLGAALVLAVAIAGAKADEPTPAALTAANQILQDIGVKSSLDLVVAEMLSGLDRNITASRPELKDALRQTLVAIEPEFLKEEEGVISDTAKFLAGKMTEQELKDVAAFYESPTGKKFMAAQPALATEVRALAGTWRQRLSTEILARAHEEMKKKGSDF